MNRIFIAISILTISMIASCNRYNSDIKRADLIFAELDVDRIDTNFNKQSGEQTINILLQDSTLREKYELENNSLKKYTFYDNSSNFNEPKYIIEIERGVIVNTTGKPFYIISKAFNDEFKLKIGDTLELIIRSAIPVFLNNSLKISRNGKMVIDDYLFRVNKDQLNLFYIIKEKGSLNYSVVYNLYSERLNYHKSDTIQFKINID